MPRLTAIITACVRSRAPNLPMILFIWLLIVSSEMESAFALARLLLPIAINLNTSISRIEMRAVCRMIGQGGGDFRRDILRFWCIAGPLFDFGTF
jgi:hypothetical protein